MSTATSFRVMFAPPGVAPWRPRSRLRLADRARGYPGRCPGPRRCSRDQPGADLWLSELGLFPAGEPQVTGERELAAQPAGPAADQRDADPPFVEHLGGGAGVFNLIRIYPSRGVGIAVMGNVTRYRIHARARLPLRHLSGCRP